MSLLTSDGSSGGHAGSNGLPPARRRTLGTLAALAAAVTVPSPARAQSFPTGPIRLVQGYNAGSGPDILARQLAPLMSSRLGAPIVVEPRPGAGERLVASQVARAPADGQTLYLMTGGQTVVAATDRSLQYDVLRDFEYLGMVAQYPFALLVAAGSPWRTLADLLEAARARPGKVMYSSVGVGTTLHLAGELLASMAGVSMLHVPYKGTEAFGDLIGGSLDMSVGTLAGSQGLVRDGRLRALCVTSPERWPGWEQVPTVAETLPGYEVVTWAALTAPAGLPAPVSARLASALADSLGEADLRARVAATGGMVRPHSPEQMRARATADVAKWRRIAAQARIELN